MGSSEYGVTADTILPSGRTFVIIGAFNAMGFLCTFELIPIIWATFKRRSGLYFWGIVVATLGSFLFNLGTTIYLFNLSDGTTLLLGLTTAISTLGYLIYIPAEYTILYSRLHLLAASQKILFWVMTLSAAEYILVTIPNAILSIGASTTSIKGFTTGYSYFQRLEIVVYMAMEITFFVIYIRHTMQMWILDSSPKVKRTLQLCLCANAVVIILDIVTVVFEFTGRAYYLVCVLVCILTGSSHYKKLTRMKQS
jgi:hypothetical protein